MDITETEGAIMQQHFVYWRQILADGKVIVYGPVMDPEGTFGVAVLQTEDQTDAFRIGENDPAVKSNAGFRFELHSMPDAIVR